MLRDGESWPTSGSLNYNTTLQLNLLCKKGMNFPLSLYGLLSEKAFQKGHGLFSTEEIPVLDPSPKDLLDLLSYPPLTALSLLPFFWAPPRTGEPGGLQSVEPLRADMTEVT